MISQEALVERALTQLERRIGTVAARLADASGSSASGMGDLDVEDVRALRRRLEQVGVGDLAELGNIADASGRLADAVAERLGAATFGGMRAPDREIDARYSGRARDGGRGADAANGERLYRMTLAQLDQIEMALGKVEGTSIRVEQLRDDAYHSNAVARYFRRLSCTAANDC